MCVRLCVACGMSSVSNKTALSLSNLCQFKCAQPGECNVYGKNGCALTKASQLGGRTHGKLQHRRTHSTA